MIEHRPFAGLGHARHGWLDATHHFSFAGYQAPGRMNWGRLRVWNDDAIAPHSGFAPHSHHDMEIITYVREGAISHEDSLGNKGRTEAGDVQVMSAGTGIQHSEWNHEDITTRLFQIWIIPDRAGEAPGWGARQFPKGARSGSFVALASGISGDDEALPIRANARVCGATILAGETIAYTTTADRHLYLVPATGKIRVGEVTAQARDGIAVTATTTLHVTALEDSEVVLVDTQK
jgi:redox-sensitive bicupin YhaK (pirin superfamily)